MEKYILAYIKIITGSVGKYKDTRACSLCSINNWQVVMKSEITYATAIRWHTILWSTRTKCNAVAERTLQSQHFLR